jgi:hypothetical protein
MMLQTKHSWSAWMPFAERRARRDGNDHLSSPAERAINLPEDQHLNERRGELRTGALSKQE